MLPLLSSIHAKAPSPLSQPQRKNFSVGNCTNLPRDDIRARSFPVLVNQKAHEIERSLIMKTRLRVRFFLLSTVVLSAMVFAGDRLAQGQALTDPMPVDPAITIGKLA